MLDFVDGIKRGFVVFGGQVDLNQIVVHLVGVLRIGEVVQEVLEDSDRFTESSECRLVYQQGVVVHGYLFHLLVERGGRSCLECHAGIVLVARLQVGLP